MNQKPLQVHEADAYVEHAPDAPPAPANRLRNALQPLVVGLMVGCIALAIVQLLRRIAPDWNGTYFLLVPIVAAFVGHTTYHAIHERYRSGDDRRRVQLIELAFIFLLLKAASYLDNTLPEIWDDVRLWPEDLLRFFDLETLTAFALACAAWFSAAFTARDLQAIVDPILYKGETGPMERLNRRFLAGGMGLLFISGLARIEITTLLEPDRPAIHGLALNVLAYFVLGLIMLGQVRFTWLNRLWEQQKYRVAGAVQKTWLKYSLLFLLVALAIAFVLPTQYTVGLLDAVGYIISVIGYLAMLIVSFVSVVFSVLISFLFKTKTDTETPLTMLPPVPPEALAEPVPGVSFPWLAVLRSIMFWIIALGAIGYVVYSYLKDRPEILRAVKAFKATQVIQRWWRAVRRALGAWWRAVWRTLREKLPALPLSLSLHFLRRKEVRQDTPAARRKREALREQMFADYLDTLDRARAEGFPRRDAQTPYEYHHTLDPSLPEAHAELTALTAAFVEARYSAHPVDKDDVARLQTNARHVRAALDKLHAARETKPTSTDLNG